MKSSEFRTILTPMCQQTVGMSWKSNGEGCKDGNWQVEQEYRLQAQCIWSIEEKVYDVPLCLQIAMKRPFSAYNCGFSTSFVIHSLARCTNARDFANVFCVHGDRSRWVTSQANPPSKIWSACF